MLAKEDAVTLFRKTYIAPKLADSLSAGQHGHPTMVPIQASSTRQPGHSTVVPTQEASALSDLAQSVASMAYAASAASTSTSTWQAVIMHK